MTDSCCESIYATDLLGDEQIMRKYNQYLSQGAIITMTFVEDQDLLVNYADNPDGLARHIDYYGTPTTFKGYSQISIKKNTELDGQNRYLVTKMKPVRGNPEDTLRMEIEREVSGMSLNNIIRDYTGGMGIRAFVSLHRFQES